ncbi:MAG: hypothetical protein MUE34_14545 [Acidimicrobiales bacterium]|nr:hypothetical protein [Acidimicrobiales bacterium]
MSPAAAKGAAARSSSRSSAGRAPAPKRPQLRVVRQPRPAPNRRVLGLLGSVAVLLIFGSLLALTVLHTLLVQGQLRIDRLTRDLQAEQERAVELRVQVADLEAPTRILAEAGRLGMVVPLDRGWLVPVEPGDPDAPLPPPGLDPFAPASPDDPRIEEPELVDDTPAGPPPVDDRAPDPADPATEGGEG